MTALILVGVVGRPHGVRGLVHVHSHTQDPDALAEYSPLVDDSGRQWKLRWQGAGIAELRDAADGAKVADRDAAARLTNLRLYVPRDRLPPPDAEEFYLADLVGLAVRDRQGRARGKVASVQDYGAGAVLEVAEESGRALLLPFTHAAVPEVDIAAGYLVIDPPDEIAGDAPARPDAPDSQAARRE